MKEWLINNWQFLMKEVLIPIITLIIGIFGGIHIEHRKNKTVTKIKENNITINGNDNYSNQGNIINN